MNKIAEEVLGYCGRLLGSKSRYSQAHPDNLVLFNSNVCTKEDGKIWFGDLDVTLEKSKLKELSKRLEKKIYVLYEMDGRFENEIAPKLERALAIINGNNIVYRKL